MVESLGRASKKDDHLTNDNTFTKGRHTLKPVCRLKTWKAIYEVIENEYFKENEGLTVEFIKFCKKFPNIPQFNHKKPIKRYNILDLNTVYFTCFVDQT